MKIITKSGKNIHPIGIGTWDIGSLRNPETGEIKAVKGNEENEIEGIRYSLSKGQNHIDTAELYGWGYTDVVVGQAISNQKREDIFIANKLWKTNVAKGKVRPTVEKMLQSLQTDYLDMLYIHAPWEDVPWIEAIPQIDELISEGLVLNFAVSNFKISDMKKAMETAKNPIVANQLHYNILHKQDATKTVRKFCKENDIPIIAYRPIARKEVFEDKDVVELAEKYNVNPAQISLAWLLKQDVLPIPKAITKSHIDENLESLNISLSEEEINKFL